IMRKYDRDEKKKMIIKAFLILSRQTKQGVVEMENDLLFPGNEKGGSPHSYTRM
ncbi:MAG: hypothetical protein ACI90V_012699, partial [Bacillariaceae sp.]